MKGSLSILIALVFCVFTLFPENARSDTPPKKKSGFVAFPILFYTPETGVMGGLNFMYLWYKKNAPASQEADIFNTYFIYTQLHQVITGFGIENYLHGGDYKNKSVFSFRKYPDRFYGIGPRVSLEEYEGYTPFEFKMIQSFLFRISRGMYLGPTLRPFYGLVQGARHGGRLDRPDLPGVQGGQAIGLGLELNWDTRDLTFYPARGFFLQVRLVGYHHYIGSRYDFFLAEIDYRYFVKLYTSHILALNYYVAIGAGNIPFQLMPRIGGLSLLRGYYEGMYRDKNMFIIQGEYRFPIYWRFGGSLFSGVGQVAPALNRFDLRFRSIKAAAGAGIRVMVKKDQKINIRFDFALIDFTFRKGRYGIYLAYTEAF